jgi:hypothetical protein
MDDLAKMLQDAQANGGLGGDGSGFPGMGGPGGPASLPPGFGGPGGGVPAAFGKKRKKK